MSAYMAISAYIPLKENKAQQNYKNLHTNLHKAGHQTTNKGNNWDLTARINDTQGCKQVLSVGFGVKRPC
jgi:hypothetical protein